MATETTLRSMIMDSLSTVRKEKPLVHNITNVVVTNVVANALISIGASPVMAYAREEVADMARIASSLALNMGTLTEDVVEAMLIAGQAANAASIPIVFDPVGVGATPYRNRAAARILEDLKVTVLRGNYGEIGHLIGAGGQVKGVDSIHGGDDLPRLMKAYAAEHNIVVAATGQVDYVSDGERVYALRNGHPLMGAVTGSGCQVTGIIGAFCGVLPVGSPLTAYALACVAAISCANIAGEMAVTLASGPGSFQVNWFDSLHLLLPETVGERLRVEILEDVQC